MSSKDELREIALEINSAVDEVVKKARDLVIRTVWDMGVKITGLWTLFGAVAGAGVMYGLMSGDAVFAGVIGSVAVGLFLAYVKMVKEQIKALRRWFE